MDDILRVETDSFGSEGAPWGDGATLVGGEDLWGDPVPGPGGGSSPRHVGGLLKEPKKLRHVPPSYPDVAKQARVQGVVVLECVISQEGRVTDVKVLRGVPLLDQAAIEAVKQWVYRPPLLNGVPVPVIITVTVHFQLS